MKKLDLDGINLIKNKIESKFFNPNIDINKAGEKQIFFDQYKMLVDSAQKSEERRKDLNSIFLTINLIFFTVLSQMTHLNDIKSGSNLVLGVLLIIATICSIHWLVLISSYKRLNYINYALIRSFENLLPTTIFSLKTDLMAELDEGSNKGNVILEKEMLIPKLFLTIYLVYLGIVVLNCFNP